MEILAAPRIRAETVKKVSRSETVPFIQKRKKDQALWITDRHRAVLLAQPDTGEIKHQL